jgi:hypothetical protein
MAALSGVLVLWGSMNNLLSVLNVSSTLTCLGDRQPDHTKTKTKEGFLHALVIHGVKS